MHTGAWKAKECSFELSVKYERYTAIVGRLNWFHSLLIIIIPFTQKVNRFVGEKDEIVIINSYGLVG